MKKAKLISINHFYGGIDKQDLTKGRILGQLASLLYLDGKVPDEVY